jgi:hypothetical protein
MLVTQNMSTSINDIKMLAVKPPIDAISTEYVCFTVPKRLRGICSKIETRLELI